MKSLVKSSINFAHENVEGGEVTPAAETGFTNLFEHSVEEALNQETEGWSIEEGEPDLWKQSSHLMMSCLCAFNFRAFATIHFNHDKPTHHYVTNLIGHGGGEESVDELVNGFFLERTNLVVGFVKRELGKKYLHLGVSAPDILSRDAIKHHQTLNHSLNIFLAASHLGSGINFPCGLYLSPYGVLDYSYSREHDHEELDTGSLEFF